MKVLVIIVAYNFERWIDRCLGSLRQSTLRPDVLVVDNASKDNTVAAIGNGYPEVRLIKSKANLGFGKANNIGMKIACEEGYDAVYLMNQDAWVLPDTLVTLCKVSEAHADYGVVSPVHLDGTEAALDKGFAAYSGKKSKADIEALANGDRDIVELPFVNAAHWFIPVAVLRRMGGFSPLFHMYGEDVDLTNRLHHLGYKMGYTPLTAAIHDRGGYTTNCYLTSYVYLLSEYANINRSFASAFAYSVLASVKSLFLSLAKARWRDAGMYARIFPRLLARTQAVVRERRAIATEGPHYIT